MEKNSKIGSIILNLTKYTKICGKTSDSPANNSFYWGANEMLIVFVTLSFYFKFSVNDLTVALFAVWSLESMRS